MPQSARIRLHPIAALRAMRNLIRDREDTRQAFLLIEALRGKTTLRQLARFRREASKIQRPPSVDEITWFRERNREMHDLLHITAGYGRDPLGEACVLAFSFAQTGLKGFAVIATVAGFRIARRLRGQHVMRAVFEAYRQGRRADWLIGADWENLLSQPLDTVRAQLRVSPPTYYPQIVPNLRRFIAATQSAQPAAL